MNINRQLYFVITYMIIGCSTLSSAPLFSETTEQSTPHIIFFKGSASPCTKKEQQQGLCQQSNPYAYCLSFKKSDDYSQQKVTCKIKGSASFAEKLTSHNKIVSDIKELIMEANEEEKSLCFDFSKDLYNLWIFQNFTEFTGDCSEMQELPEESWTPQQQESERCDSHWPCAMNVLVKKSSFTFCTDELAKNGLCQINDTENLWGCLIYSNEKMRPLTCDIRLEMNFLHNKEQFTTESSIRREEKLYPQQQQTLCFKYPGKGLSDFLNIKGMQVVCSDTNTHLNTPSDLCDVESDDCTAITRMIVKLVKGE